MDVAGFFAKWLGDVAADQFADGAVPHVVPNVLPQFAGRDPGGAAGWADAATIIPWNMYLAYGDRRILETQYESMARWVELPEDARRRRPHLDGDFHFGDWLAFASAGMAANAYPGATTGTGFHRHRVLRPLDRSPPPHRPRARARRTMPPATRTSSRRSRRRSSGSS